jgi:hypothetical protein
MADEEHFFDFSNEDYIFAFGEEDDFSEVKILNFDEHGNEVSNGAGGWALTDENPYVGNRCIKWTGSEYQAGNAWLFSRGFEFEPDQRYVAGIYYSAGPTPRLGRFGEEDRFPGRVRNLATLHLRLGRTQEPEAMTQSLFDLGVANPDYQYAKAWFQVPEPGVYYFSLHAHGDRNANSIFVGVNGAALVGGLEDF